MNSTRFLYLLGLLFLSLFVFTRADDDFEDDGFIKCGFLFDGITKEKDIGRQKDDYPISANWAKFTHDDDKDAKIKYQFAIISQDVLTETILHSGPEAPTKKRCRRDDGLEGFKPDVVGWTTLTFDGKKSSSDTDGAFRIYDLDLEKKYRYYVILSAQYKDEIIYTNSDGVYITDRDNYDDDEEGCCAPYQAGLIAMGAAICCILLLLLLLLIIFLVAFRNKDDKYQTVVQRS